MKRCYPTKFILCGICCLFSFFSSHLSAQCNLSCQSANVNVAINQDGMSEITSAFFVTGMTGTCAGNFTIQLFNNLGTDIGNIATCEYVGASLTARITHDDSGNFCESTLNIEDNLGPVITCPNDEIDCSASTAQADVAAVTALDNCDPSPIIQLQSETITDQVCTGQPFNRIITRVFTASDANGNQSLSTCAQTISVRSAALSDVVFPMNFDNVELPALDCSATYPTSAETGEPTIFGNSAQESCKINITFTDQVLNICDGTYKILRNWTALDCCTGDTRTDTQLIKIADTTSPTVTCPAPLTFGTNSNCTGTVILPALAVSDNCSSTISVRIFSMFGDFTTNGTTINNVPAGTHIFNYRFTDACGNETLCPVEVTVADDDGPTMICEQFIDVSIGTASVAFVDALDLNEGSFDNCCPNLTFEVKRQGENDTQYAAQEEFICTDIGMRTLILRATDCNNFTNTCTIQVEVEDKTAPFIACPAAITLECTQFPATTSVSGAPNFFDNCGIATMTFSDVLNLNACNSGTVTRTFTVGDGGGLSASCSHVITFEDNTPMTVTFPDDAILNSCDAMADPNATGVPIVNSDCEMTAYSIQNDTFVLQNGCGLKILRTHTIMEMCSGMEFSDVQEIQVIDGEAPTFVEVTGALDVSFDCAETIIVPAPPTAIDACGSAILTIFSDVTTNMGCDNSLTRVITYQAEDACGNTALYSVNISVSDTTDPVISCPGSTTTFEIGNCTRVVNLPAATATDDCSNITITNDSPFATASNENASGTYALGMTVITFTATDDCGNTDFCQTEVNVNDVSGPSMQCNSPLTIYMTLDTFAVLQTDSIDNGSFDNCSNPIALTLSRDTLRCPDILASPLTVTMTGIDTDGNMNTCTSNVFVFDTLDVCDNERPALTAGTIRRTNGTPLAEISVNMQNFTNFDVCQTSEAGLYYFYHEYEENPCQITPFSNDNPATDVTSWDLILIKRHVLSVETFTSPYQYLAADVNASGTISMADVVAARRVILAMDSEFPNSPSWRFIPENFVFENENNPFDGEIPEEYLMTNPVWEEIDLNFIGIKVGDVSGI